MADDFNLTGNPVRLTAPGKQRLDLSMDVSDYDLADILLQVLTLEGTGPNTVVRIITGMQTETEDGWVPAVTFTAVNASNAAEMKLDVHFLRYIRWEVTVLTGASAVITFAVRGMLRRRSM